MKFNLDDFLQLDVNGLLSVNGGGYCSGASDGTTVYSNPYYGGSSSSQNGGGGSGSQPINTSGSCSNINLSKYIQPTKAGQKDFSSDYGENFGKNACGATSLLNEVSEIYTKQTGKALSDEQMHTMMKVAVANGAIDKNDAFVNSWTDAAESMLLALGYVDGTARMTDKNGTITVISVDKTGDGRHDHFVNDLGNGRYYDPWTKEEGYIKDLKLTSLWDSNAVIKSPYRHIVIGGFC